MKANELYKLLEKRLRPLLGERDFKKQRKSRLTFQRLVGDKYQSVWFQCDKWGWDAYAGSSFFVNFTVSATPDVEGIQRREERLNFFLTDEELERARAYRDKLVSNIPKPPESYFDELEAGFARSVGPESAASLIQTVRDQFEPEPLPYRRNQDFGLRYWSPADVEGWASFIAPVLPRAIQQMQTWTLRSIIVATMAFAPAAYGQQVDTARALSALRDAQAVCSADSGNLWHHSLCGPIALVDRQTRMVIANDTVAGRHFIRFNGAFVTTLPANQFIANTSFAWGGREWTMVSLPLPADRYSRVALVMHEVFHREQKSLGLGAVDALNNHLDLREGRTWLRLEYRALASALRAADRAAIRKHVENTLTFRAMRRSLYPGADSTETLLEIQEGLPEYNGQRLAMQLTGEPRDRVARYVTDYEKNTPTFVRAFAYGTGPAIGALLDELSPNWRDQIRTRRDLAGLLANAIGFRAPKDLANAARRAAQQYGWTDVNREELARDSARAPAMRDYRARLSDGPTITLRQSKDSLSWGYDPTAIIGFDMKSAIYPFGSFSAPWGKLDVEKNGVLVFNDFSIIRVGAPTQPLSMDAKQIEGDGWKLTLNAGWKLAPDPSKPGSFIVTKQTD